MLKIKDNLDIKEVDNFLFEKGFYTWKDLNGNEITGKYGHFKIAKNKHIIPLNGGGNARFDIIYDLIQAGYIEKVEE